MNLAITAYEKLFSKQPEHTLILKYSGRFRGYNANVRMRRNVIEVRMSKQWKEVSPEIQMGCIQSLLLKLFKKKKSTTEIGLYDTFIKKVHIAVPKTRDDPVLSESYERVNEKYFYGLIDKPNLRWGSKSLRTLGSYEYGTDTVTISRALENADSWLLDFVMYHELLHKKHKFTSKNGRSYHHTTQFRKSEKQFENYELAEKELAKHLRKQRIRRFFW
ncbi:M48 family peptidase [Candidatus Woesearchaeota archaeon]|nr:MAG: M48 family peptidase [Candidatus Woesearchaeota archaeon]